MEDENRPTWSKDMLNPPLKMNKIYQIKYLGKSPIYLLSSSSLSPPVSAALSEQMSVQYENYVSAMNQVSSSDALTQQTLVNIANCNNVN
ncbi:hypothetical protein NQ317_014604, partial [Molorchus minor]